MHTLEIPNNSLSALTFFQQPLRDPKEEAKDADCEEAIKNMAMDEMLSELHGARTFKEFILTKRKGAQVPSFLSAVDTNPTKQQQALRPK